MSRVIGEWTEHGNYPIVQVVGLKVIAPATALRMNISSEYTMVLYAAGVNIKGVWRVLIWGSGV